MPKIELDLTAEALSVTLDALAEHAHRCRMPQYGQWHRSVVADSARKAIAGAALLATQATSDDLHTPPPTKPRGGTTMRSLALLVTIIALLFTVPANAGVNVEQVDGDLYFLQYQMGRGFQMAAPGVAGLMDSKKKADKKIGKHLHRVCVEEGYGFFYELKPADIMRDETLRAYFEMYAGGKLHEQREFGEHNMRANITKRFVYFATEQGKGYLACTG